MSIKLLLFLAWMASSIQMIAQPVTWTSKVIDLETIPQGTPAIATFTFQNVSNDTLVVELVRTTCGCTAADWTQVPIPPRESGTIDVTYDAWKMGPFYKKIRVFFYDIRRPQKITIQGVVE